MEDAVRQFLESLRLERRCSSNTLVAYQGDLRQLSQVLSSRLGRIPTPGDLTPEALAHYASWLSSRGYRATTIARKLAAVRSFLEHQGWGRGADPTSLRSALHSPAPRKQPTRVLTPEEIQVLLRAPERLKGVRGVRDQAILALLYGTAMRASEVVSLRVEDIDLGRGVAFRRGPSADEDQAVPLGPAVEPLRRYLQHGRPQLVRSPSEPALFLNQRGQRLSRQGVWLVIKRWAAAAGLEQRISPHTLRHSRAAHLLDSGKTRRQVQDMLGLRSPNSLGRRRREAQAR